MRGMKPTRLLLALAVGIGLAGPLAETLRPRIARLPQAELAALASPAAK